MAQILFYFSTKLLIWGKKGQKDNRKDVICKMKTLYLPQKNMRKWKNSTFKL